MFIRILGIILFLCQMNQAVFADDEMAQADKARAFPIQKNKTVIHSSTKNSEATSEEQAASQSSVDTSKPAPKDTSLSIHGNGGSSNRAAGGNGVLRKRFTFD